MSELVRRVMSLRKRSLKTNGIGTDPKQLALPEFAKHLLPFLPPKIPLIPELEEGSDGESIVDEALKNEELPWQTIWRCTVDELERYEQMLTAQIINDQRRRRRVRELLKAAKAGCDGDNSIKVIDAINRAPVE